MAAEGGLQRRLTHAQAHLGLEELPPITDQIDHGDRRPADLRRQLRQVVEITLARGIQHLIAVQRKQALGLVSDARWVDGRVHFVGFQGQRVNKAQPR